MKSFYLNGMVDGFLVLRNVQELDKHCTMLCIVMDVSLFKNKNKINCITTMLWIFQERRPNYSLLHKSNQEQIYRFLKVVMLNELHCRNRFNIL